MIDFNSLKQSLDSRGVTLVAVSKTKPVEELKRVYDMGQRVFGENRVNELRDKHPLMPEDTEWHMIGHLQTNKVKYIAPFISMIHSVDTVKLLSTIDQQAKRYDRVIDVLLQFKIASEETKSGFALDEFMNEVTPELLQSLGNVRIRGVMGMASFVDDGDIVRSEFKRLRQIFEELKTTTFTTDTFDQISMGMSGDYEIAIEEGSTMVRIGSLIFGARH